MFSICAEIIFHYFVEHASTKRWQQISSYGAGHQCHLLCWALFFIQAMSCRLSWRAPDELKDYTRCSQGRKSVLVTSVSILETPSAV